MPRILIIDDDIEFCANVAAWLEDQGHEVSPLHDYEEALERVIATRPDLLILDVMFPSNPTAGLEVARQVRRVRELRAMPILMLTGVSQEFPGDFSGEDIDPAWMPVQDFVEKPSSAAELRKKVSRLLKTT